MKTLKVLLMAVLMIVSFVQVSSSAVQDEPFDDEWQQEDSSAKSYRFEVLVYSSQIRLMKITGTEEKIGSIIPAVTAQKDSFVPFNREVSILMIKVDPPWVPTSNILKEEPGVKIRPVGAGQPGNPLGSIAFYPNAKQKGFERIRIHEAPEIVNRKLETDANGNLKGYRESHGCASVSQEDMVEYTNILTGIDQSSIQKMISLRKTKILRPAIPTTMVFLKE